MRVEQGERIAQLILFPIHTPRIAQTDFLPESDRGENAFGSTGR